MITQIIVWIVGVLAAIVFIENLIRYSKGKKDRPMTPGEQKRYLIYMFVSFVVATSIICAGIFG